jgi:hypothetical protein
MDLLISYPGFEGRNLIVRTQSFLSSARLFIDGAPVRKEKGRYVLQNNRGQLVEAKLKSNIFDPVPKLQIANETIILAEPLKWYEYIWIALPLVLLAIGGALGGGIGAAAAFTNAMIFRNQSMTAGKYILTLLITIGAVGLYLVLAIAIRGAFR